MHHSQQTNIHAPGGIRTHDLSRQAAADLRLRPCGHWNWQDKIIEIENISLMEAEIINIIKSCKLKNCSVYDEFSSRIIKYCVLEIGKPLHHIHISSLQSGIYPERFKYLVAGPIYKQVTKLIRQIASLYH